MESELVYFSIGLIVAVIVLIRENDKLREENKRLKNELSKYKNNATQSEWHEKNNKVSTSTINGVNNQVYVTTNNTTNNQTRIPQKQVKKQTMTKEKSKNVLILVSGSIFIVLSAIVFLMSTWNVIPNILKTIVLILLIGVFLGASQIAEKKLKLKLTSATFYYLAMAYIPIMLLSVWGFELLGKYLSIHGEGKFIYLTVMSSIVSLVYFIESKKKKGSVLIVSSSIFQILAVIFGVLIFSKKANTVWLGLLIYSIFITTTLYNIKKKKYREFYKHYSLILTIGLIVGLTCNMLEKWILIKCEYINVINFVLIIINLLIMNKNNKIYRGYIKNVLTELLNIAILLGALTLLSIKGIELINGTKLFTMSLVAIIIYALDYIKTKKILFKTIVYILINFALLSILIMVELTEYAKYIPIVSTGLAVLSEQFKRDEDLKYYILVSFIISFLTLNIDSTIFSFIIILISIVAYKFYEKDNNLNEGWDIVPIIAIIPNIYWSNLFMLKNNSFNFAILISIGLIIYETVLSIAKEKINQKTVISLICIILSAICFKMNVYVKIFMFIIWSLSHITLHKSNKIYQPVLFISSLVLYLVGIKDLKINDFTCLKIIGYIGCTLLITRITLSDNKEAQKIVEYIAMAIIYWLCMYLYKNVADAMLVIAVMLSLVIIGYMQKMGPIFLTSLIAIVINGFKLTKDFWLSIPWWIYLLIIGSVLILFAINNEINQKDNQKNLMEKFKRIKEDINI